MKDKVCDCVLCEWECEQKQWAPTSGTQFPSNIILFTLRAMQNVQYSLLFFYLISAAAAMATVSDATCKE